MLKLFRNIRKQLLRENRFSKYLLYGIGEIFLVVIGILIALSINNLNESRKDKQNEIQTLNAILNNLKEDKENLIFSIKHFEHAKQCID